MTLCDVNHVEVAYSCAKCPVCRMMAKRDEAQESLEACKDQVAALKDEKRDAVEIIKSLRLL